MPTNDYDSFAAGGGANTLTHAAWVLLATLRANGFQPGLADAQQINTLLRQLSVGVAGVAKFSTDHGPNDMLDDGSIANFKAGFLAALDARIAAATYAPPSPITFSPTLLFNGASTGITYASQIGRYTVFGKLVTFSAVIELTSKGSASGNASLLLGGLPSAQFNAPCQLSLDLMSVSPHPSGMVASGTNSLQLRAFDNAGSDAAMLTDGNFNNNSVLYAQGFYFTP